MTSVFRHTHGVLSLDKPAVMGILNITPDSFSDGGLYMDTAAAVRRAQHMEQEGAAVIDIGAQSTRPGAVPLSAEEEWSRLEPVLTALRGELSIPLSIDTFEPLVAERALKAGAAILNDVSGSEQNGFPALAARHNAGLIMMAHGCRHPDEVAAYFRRAQNTAAAVGLSAEHLCLDIGIGFHPDRETDLALIRALPALTAAALPCAVLCGASRKRVIAYCAGDSDPADRLGGSVALHTAAVLGGVRLLRVHDVKETVQAVAVINALQQHTP